MEKQSKFTKIHFEMASITEKNLLLRILDLIVPFADSLGMNEQVRLKFSMKLSIQDVSNNIWNFILMLLNFD